MTKLDEVDLREINNLVKYIPIIKDPSFNPLDEGGPEPGFQMKYSQKADEFIKALSSSYWFKMNYDGDNARRLIDDKKNIENASLEDIKDFFSFLHHGEKFGVGLFNTAFKDGFILCCLDRLRKIYDDN